MDRITSLKPEPAGYAMASAYHSVMISGTYVELQDHRAAVSQVALGLGMHPLDMGNDAALSKDLITASLDMVNKADAYVGLISYRYGQIVEDPENPNKLSLTELEFDRAEKQGIPRCMFIMADNYPGIPRSLVLKEAATQEKLDAFIARARKGSICAEFNSVDDLKAKAALSLGVLQQELGPVEPGKPSEPSEPAPPSMPEPPAFHAHPSYPVSTKFHGRAQELTELRDWAGAAEPIMLIEAIGGMGKSMLTWEWVTNNAEADRTDAERRVPNKARRNGSKPRQPAGWSGRFWYSFYERGADMRDFCVTALEYITRRPRSELLARPMPELVEDLLFHLHAKPFLLVLDGLERVLAAYHRSDAAQLADDEAEASEGATGKLPTDCIRPADDELLGLLRTAAPSKILISSRLMPRALLNRMGQPVPGVRHLLLRGLDPRDAEQMLHEAGVTGNAERMRRYLDEKFGCHPLLVEIVGGLVLNYMKAPGQFDRWVDDPAGGGAVNLADPDIRVRRTHILRLAFDGLDANTRELLTRIAMISSAVTWEVVAALNPALPRPSYAEDLWRQLAGFLRRKLRGATTGEQRAELEWQIAERQREQRERYETARQAYVDYLAGQAKYGQSAEVRVAEPWLNAALANLVRRGLLQREHGARSFDLHPVVRGYAVALLDPEARAQTGKLVADYFAASPAPVWDTVESLNDLAAPVQVVQTLNLADQTAAAWDVLRGDLSSALYRLERYHETLALLRPLFPRGWLDPPEGIRDLNRVAFLAAINLGQIGLLDAATAQEVVVIQNNVRRGMSASLSLTLRNHAETTSRREALARVERILGLARAVAAAVASTRQIACCELFLIGYQRARGALAEARAGWASLAPFLGDGNRARHAIRCPGGAGGGVAAVRRGHSDRKHAPRDHWTRA
jgi:hypothetical protein